MLVSKWRLFLCLRSLYEGFRQYSEHYTDHKMSSLIHHDCSSLITEKDHLNSYILGIYVCLCVR